MESNNNKFSIIIPTWNNLPYLKICIESIKKNSRFLHEIIVHLNEAKQDEIEWLNKQKIEFTFSEVNVGICNAVNTAFTKASGEFIVYMNDDMYCCPDWDLYLWNEIKSIKNKFFFLSATMIEPESTGNVCVIAPFDFGRTAETFKEDKLLEALSTFNRDDWQGSTWPPNLVHRDLWEDVGGYSIEFSPGMYSDPDFSMKLWQKGVRYYKGVGKSLIYHFMSKSTKKVKKNNGRKMFIKKWGMSSSHFTKNILMRGQSFNGPLPDVDLTPTLKDRIKKLFA